MQDIAHGYKSAFKIFSDALANIVLLSFLNMLVLFISLIITFVFFIFLTAVYMIIGGAGSLIFESGGMSPDSAGVVSLLLSLLTGIVFIFISIIFGSIMQGALLYNVNDIAKGHPQKKLMEYVNMGWKVKWRLFGLSILIGIFIGVGMLFLIIPGVLMLIFFSFAFHTLLFENKTISKSLKSSYEIVKTDFFGFTGRMILLTIVISIITGISSLIPIGGNAIQLFTAGFAVCYTYVLYSDMRTVSLKEVN